MRKIILFLSLFVGILIAKDIECNGDECAQLGALYHEEGNYKEANKYFAKSCNQNNYMACFILAYAYDNAQGVKKDTKKANELYAKACTGNFYQACYNLGISYSQKKDYKTAFVLNHKSCDGNISGGCFNVGVAFSESKGVEHNLDMAKKYYQKACDLGSKQGCEASKKVEKIQKDD
ncbi:sel1 repeat family protein [Campylobacter lari]|nr:sel1 repeat family protein [Campylobacter lari]